MFQGSADFVVLGAYFVFGVFGLSIFNLGRKRGKPLPILFGIALMIYPYFFSNPYVLWLAGIVLLAAGYRSL